LKVAVLGCLFFSATLPTPQTRRTKGTNQDDIPGGQENFENWQGKCGLAKCGWERALHDGNSGNFHNGQNYTDRERSAAKR